jgi:hypothetical protein
MRKNKNLPVYVASDELLQDLHDLGYSKSIELEDLIDFLEEDESYILDIYVGITTYDELAFMSPVASKVMHKLLDARPT